MQVQQMDSLHADCWHKDEIEGENSGLASCCLLVCKFFDQMIFGSK